MVCVTTEERAFIKKLSLNQKAINHISITPLDEEFDNLIFQNTSQKDYSVLFFDTYFLKYFCTIFTIRPFEALFIIIGNINSSPTSRNLLDSKSGERID